MTTQLTNTLLPRTTRCLQTSGYRQHFSPKQRHRKKIGQSTAVCILVSKRIAKMSSLAHYLQTKWHVGSCCRNVKQDTHDSGVKKGVTARWTLHSVIAVGRSVPQLIISDMSYSKYGFTLTAIQKKPVRNSIRNRWSTSYDYLTLTYPETIFLQSSRRNTKIDYQGKGTVSEYRLESIQGADSKL